MVDRVDSSAYACDIASSLERLMCLAGDESPYHNFQDFRGRRPPPSETFLPCTCYTREVALPLRFAGQDGHDLKPWTLGRMIPNRTGHRCQDRRGGSPPKYLRKVASSRGKSMTSFSETYKWLTSNITNRTGEWNPNSTIQLTKLRCRNNISEDLRKFTRNSL